MTESKATERLEKASGGTSLSIYSRVGFSEVELRSGVALTIGREAPADIVIDDPSLSRLHARFMLNADLDVTVEDVGSTNGIVVRGARVERSVLGHDVEVRLGEVLVVVRNAETRGAEDLFEEHGDFLARVDDEIVRSRQFGRPMALLALASTRNASAARFAPSVRSFARAVDHFGHYAGTICLLSMPETSREQATAFARSLEPLGLSWGIAIGPRDGTSGAELLEAALQALSGDAAPESLRPMDGVITSRNASLTTLLRELERVAPTKLNVLLYGETGSGKDVLARFTHRKSGAPGEFRAVNCGAIAPSLLESTLFGHEKGAFTGAMKTHKGIFEQAHQGTVFLDEIGDLPASAQVALLRVLESNTIQRVGTEADLTVDVRVIAATHKDLDAMVAEGTFRQDLLFRLDGFSGTVPPLRDRREDLPALTSYFLGVANARHGRSVGGLTPFAQEVFANYPFPGNVRELRNVLERAVVLCDSDRIDVRDLPERMRKTVGSTMPATVALPPPAALPTASLPLDFRERIRRYEVDLMREALHSSRGNRTRAAESLQMPLRTFFSKLREYGLDDEGT